MEEHEKAKPVIIKKVKRNVHGHHGGSWKVAFADFATAMMAFFLLLWLIGNTSEDQKRAISGYFHDPSGFSDKGGSKPNVIGDKGQNASIIEFDNIQPETEEVEELTETDIEKLAEEQETARLELLKLELESLVDNSDAFEQFKDQVIIDITPSGLRIQIVDKDKRPMFDSGSAEPKNYSRVILNNLAGVLKQVPNKLSVTGHTDATPYVEKENYGNWELSADRANSARRELLKGGILEDKIARVEGFSSSILFDAQNPYDPINRRIAIIVLKSSVAENIEKQVLGVE